MKSTNTPLSREPYKGTRDFYPQDMAIQQYIFSTMRSVVERYGYCEYTASILEETALYAAKTGEEIVNEQTYSFTDRGGREVTLRPEMTPTVARMVAQKRNELAFPLRWYSIPNLFRYERPQRGRLREHWQLNVDLFGTDNIAADAELVTIAGKIMEAFGAQPTQFEIRINSRKLINDLFTEYLQVNETIAYKISKLIDKKNKISNEEFTLQSQELIGEKTTLLQTFLQCKTIQDVPHPLNTSLAVAELQSLFQLLAQQGITNTVFDPTLMRGFDYYTGTIFEVFDISPENNRSLFGGGRYDDLVSIFGVEKVTAVGFGMGDVTIRDYLETYSLLPQYHSPTQIYICTTDASVQQGAIELAEYLRAQKVNVAVDYTTRKIGAQIKTAEKQHIPFIICIGEEEISTKQVRLKNIEERIEQLLAWKDIPTALQ